MRKRRQYQIKNFNMYDFNDFNFTIKSGEEINLAENQITELIQKLKNREYNEDGINFIPELIFVETGNKVDKNHLKNLLVDGVEVIDKNEIENENMNGKKYVRLVRSSSMARNGTIAFIQEDLKDKMMELISLNKLKCIDKAVISKLESYLGLAFSTTMFINEVPNNVCIVDADKFKITINDYVKTVKDNKVVQGLYDVHIELFDGQGLHTPEYGKKVSKALELDYTPVGYQIRLLPSVKGMSFEIDFKKFYKEHGIEYITDYTGKQWKVSDLDCIWTTSMFKFSKYFDGWKELKELREKYYTPISLNQIGISSYSENKNNKDKKSKMTYQYLQSLALNGEDLIDMSQYTKDIVSRVYSGDLGATMLFLGLLQQPDYIDDEGNVTDDIDEENMMATKVHYAISKNPKMIHDPYIQSFLQRQLAKTINNAKLGKIYVNGQYSFSCQDPVAMLEMIAGLNPVGSLEKDEFYSTGAEGTYATFRSPLTHSSEVSKLNLINNKIAEKWLSRYKNILVFNAKDITLQKSAGADTDGDQFLWTNNKTIINAVIDKFNDGSPNYPVIDIFESENRAEATDEEYILENIINYDLRTLNNTIGEVTNIATYFSCKGYKNLKEYDKELIIASLCQNESIDFVKHGIKTIVYPDNFNTAKKYKPYFLQKYKYNRDKNIQQNVVNAPLNILCRNIEQFEKELYKKDKAKIIDTTNILIDRELLNEDKEESKKLYKELKNIYANYKKQFGAIYLKCKDKHENYRKKVYDNFYTKYHAEVNNLSYNKELLSSLAVHLNYVEDKKNKTDGSYLFPWVTTWEGLALRIDKTAPAIVQIPKLLTRDEIEKLEIKDAREFLGKFYKIVETTNKVSAFDFIDREYERKINKELKQQVKNFELETVLYGYKPRTTDEIVSIINSGNLHLGSKEYNGKQFAGVFMGDEYIASIKDRTEEIFDDEIGFIDLKQMRNKVDVAILETSKASMKVRLRIVS